MSTIKNGNVVLIDPNDVINDNLKNVNKLPDYSRMFIFVELIAKRRGRSSLVRTQGETRREFTGLEKDISVNMMGFDPNLQSFTTKWTENNTLRESIYEGFGITSVDVNVNASFVPTVKIKFVDTRGMALANKGYDSPYNLLFDFPPPQFSLTLKGYYGRALRYDLHLTKFNIFFNESTDNYEIECDFIARTFAPLNDLPFKYITTFPFIDNNIDAEKSVNVNNTIQAKNTKDFIEKLKNLYDQINELRNESTLADEIKNLIKTKNDINVLLNKITTFSSRLENELKNNGIIGVLDENEDENSLTYFREIRSLKIYNSILSENDSIGQTKKLIIGIKSTNNTNNLINLKLKNFTNEIIVKGKIINNNINRNDIIPISDENFTTLDLNFSNENYKYIDITNYYKKIFENLSIINDEIEFKNGELGNAINESVINELGTIPRIYDVFKLICDDVDLFFKKLKDVTRLAENHHNTYADNIITNLKNIKDRENIGAFPLYTKKNIICNKERQSKHIPDEREFPDIETFPEVDLVDDFINTIINLKKDDEIKNMRIKIDPNNNNTWIPITPQDSILNKTVDYNSPYYNIYTGNASSAVENIFNIVINRFYIGTQYTFPYIFFSKERFLERLNTFFSSVKLKPNQYSEFIAGAEAVNLLNSLAEDNVIDTLENISDDYLNLNNDDAKLNYLSNFDKYGNIEENRLILQNNIQVYRNKEDVNFKGCSILSDSEYNNIVSRNNLLTNNNPIDTYLSNKSNFLSLIVGGSTSFTKENVLYYKDINLSEYKSRYTYEFNFVDNMSNFIAGNNNLINFKNFLENNNIREDVKFFIIASAGLNVDSVFGGNIVYLTNPSLIEMPLFNLIYLGGLELYNRNNQFKIQIDEIIDNKYFDIDSFVIPNGVNRIRNFKRDVESFNKKLSNNDKNLFLNQFQNSLADINIYNLIKINMINLLNNISVNIIGVNRFNSIKNELLNSQSKICNILCEKKGLLNYTQLTFTDDSNTSNRFFSIRELTSNLSSNEFGLNTDTEDRKKRIVNYFNFFFKELKKGLGERKNFLDNKISALRNRITNDDIRIETYYSFKNISDKWLAGGYGDYGYPYNTSQDDKLINKFMFVDRAMNPIGNECVIDVESLIEMSKDYDLSVFTVLSRLLSLNNFEFFPMSNFMAYEDNEWGDTFKIFDSQESINRTAPPAFVCMYIGGSSSVLDIENSSFMDDGVETLENLRDLTDFSGDPCDTQETENKFQYENTFNTKYPYSEVRAFRVRYGEQNQSIFKSMSIDSREFAETNEALGILSKIASDESSSTPVAVGQNLYSIYEQRAFTCSIPMFGNMMIQPTQYFQLENGTIFTGAYLIISVEHSFTANFAETKFTGVRILKYPYPIVRDFASLYGFQMGKISSENKNVVDNEIVDSTKIENSIGQGDSTSLPQEMKYNTIYELRI